MRSADKPGPSVTRDRAEVRAPGVDWLAVAVLAALSLIFVAEALLALGWKIEHDAPLMLYAAYLIDQLDFAPYRDIHDFNLPGTYLFNVLLLRVFGTGEAAFRVADLVVWALIAGLSGLWLRKFGRLTVWAGAVLFGLVYFHFGPLVTLQREYIALLPIGAALAVALNLSERRPRGAQLLAGLLFGLAASVKPHLAAGAPFVVIYQMHGRYTPQAWVRAILWSVAGFAVPLGATLAYIGSIGAWRPFWEIVREYWPLYRSLGSDLAAGSPWTHLRHYLSGLNHFAGLGLLLVPATLGAACALRRPRSDAQQRFVVLLVALAVVFGLCTAVAGRFWAYHWLICCYCVALLAAACFAECAERVSRAERRVGVLSVFFCFMIAAHPHLEALPRALAQEVDGRQERVAEIAQFLGRNLREGDTVQPLDWTGGAVQAMLAARARLATPFLYDFYFYHDVSTPYVQRLRARFIESLGEARPRYVIQMIARPWPSGRDVSRTFPELEQHLRDAYRPVRTAPGYVIWELR